MKTPDRLSAASAATVSAAPARKLSPDPLLAFYQSSIGKKIIVAVTGLILIVYHRAESKLVSPNNKRKFDILVVGSGLAGASAAATLAELGYNVKCCFQDSSRRAHSIAAQGGINAAKNYQNEFVSGWANA